jgi:hypothetical protein
MMAVTPAINSGTGVSDALTTARPGLMFNAAFAAEPAAPTTISAMRPMLPSSAGLDQPTLLDSHVN